MRSSIVARREHYLVRFTLFLKKEKTLQGPCQSQGNQGKVRKISFFVWQLEVLFRFNLIERSGKYRGNECYGFDRQPALMYCYLTLNMYTLFILGREEIKVLSCFCTTRQFQTRIKATSRFNQNVRRNVRIHFGENILIRLWWTLPSFESWNLYCDAWLAERTFFTI